MYVSLCLSHILYYPQAIQKPCPNSNPFPPLSLTQNGTKFTNVFHPSISISSNSIYLFCFYRLIRKDGYTLMLRSLFDMKFFHNVSKNLILCFANITRKHFRTPTYFSFLYCDHIFSFCRKVVSSHLNRYLTIHQRDIELTCASYFFLLSCLFVVYWSMPQTDANV